MPYLALARQWRPKRFEEIVGQSHIVETLRSTLSQQKLHHAYLFTGTQGVGKTTLARIFAKCVNCETGITPTPCEKCSACVSINEGCFPDLYEIDAASRTKVEDTRELLDSIPYAPTQGRYKIYLIDEVHMLSTHSFNALLKTLEEPPETVLFLLATTDPQKLPVTVLSRCLQFHLSKMDLHQIEKQLAHILSAEKINFEKEALTLIAQSAHGSMRDALTLLDQCIAYCGDILTTEKVQTLLGITNQAEIIELLTHIHRNDAAPVLTFTEKMAKNGVQFSRVLTQLLSLLHHIAIARIVGKTPPILLTPEETQRYYQIVLNGQKELAISPSPQIGAEMIFLRMMSLPVKREEKQVFSWIRDINQLKLTGAVLALAKLCVEKSFDQKTLELTLDPKYKAMLNTRHQETIQEAMRTVCGHPVQVHITLSVSSGENPLLAQERSQAAKIATAKNAISADPSVQRMIKTFDANVIENSVKPLTTPTGE